MVVKPPPSGCKSDISSLISATLNAAVTLVLCISQTPQRSTGLRRSLHTANIMVKGRGTQTRAVTIHTGSGADHLARADALRRQAYERSRDRPGSYLFEALVAVADLRLSDHANSAAVEEILMGGDGLGPPNVQEDHHPDPPMFQPFGVLTPVHTSSIDRPSSYENGRLRHLTRQIANTPDNDAGRPEALEGEDSASHPTPAVREDPAASSSIAGICLSAVATATLYAGRLQVYDCPRDAIDSTTSIATTVPISDVPVPPRRTDLEKAPGRVQRKTPSMESVLEHHSRATVRSPSAGNDKPGATLAVPAEQAMLQAFYGDDLRLSRFEEGEKVLVYTERIDGRPRWQRGTIAPFWNHPPAMEFTWYTPSPIFYRYMVVMADDCQVLGPFRTALREILPASQREL
ncbi:hypothetical protein BN946_scf185001.g53 [Trametes cinnabarina]|uniref:Uncharacterized protein n=1 Tax=Pycnoporus cinnabarinus TaxID=5643 RepID=A0A060SKC8_PYCCI|nr:hypothetical protein BN946_scf185001.g53 [Trametes cinnabarina]